MNNTISRKPTKSGDMPYFNRHTREYTWQKESHKFHDFILRPVELEGPRSTLYTIHKITDRILHVSESISAGTGRQRTREELVTEVPEDELLLGTFSSAVAIVRLNEWFASVHPTYKYDRVTKNNSEVAA